MSGSYLGPEVEPERRIAYEQMRAGEYEAAIPYFERQTIDNPVMGSWNAYGTALLCAGELEKAEQAYRRPRELPSPHGNVTLSVGTALWLQGRYSDACADWREELGRIMTTKLKRYNAAGIFICDILWWAYRRLGTPEMWSALQPQVKLVLKTCGQQEVWGLTIMQFIVDGISNSELLTIAPDAYEVGNKDPTSRPALQQITQAHFYIAGKNNVGSSVWRKSLETAVQSGNPAALSYPEYHIAKYELAHT
jgi:tetratricopeptide (TPR) repeat protein